MFDTWLAHARPGEQFVYFTGYLRDERKHSSMKWPGKIVQVRKAYNEGLVDLVQTKAPVGYVYTAIRRQRRARPIPAIPPNQYGFWGEHLNEEKEDVI